MDLNFLSNSVNPLLYLDKNKVRVETNEENFQEKIYLGTE